MILATPILVVAQDKGAIDSTLLARFEKRAADDPNLTRPVNAATNNDIRDMSPNHVMVLLAVDTTASGTSRKWRVENSWGSSIGSGGYWTMYDTWFDENVLLVLVDKKLLSETDAALLDQKPVVLEDWQPFFRALTRLQ